jgi:hypothetical protein
MVVYGTETFVRMYRLRPADKSLFVPLYLPGLLGRTPHGFVLRPVADRADGVSSGGPTLTP